MLYKNKKLFIDKISVNQIIKKFGTPTYCYSYNKLKENILNFKRNFKNIDPLICFAIKANNNIKILNEIAKFGLGADVVSKGELLAALKSKINPKKIVFSGVGKTYDEINFAIKKKILLINAESQSEIETILKIAKKLNRSVDIGIRLNPNVDAKTIKEITTGKTSNKFGLTENEIIDLINHYKKSKYLNIKCLSVHIGSQITSHIPYLKMLKAIQKIMDKFKFSFEYIDLGGGMGINYGENNQKLNYKKYSNKIEKFVKKNSVKIIFEPGRSIIGNTGSLLSKIIYIKKIGKINFIIIDAGMNDLMRPALYKAYHRIIPTNKNRNKVSKRHDFVGPICETTDKFLSMKSYQKLNEGDNIVICDVGAYGKVLSSNYNLRTSPKEILIKDSKVFEIRKKETLQSII
jgi:diaminopimelate decarboxylase|tara:strand:- start:10386 stop:11600 length:1215 start_codon:yes stop_codon:yes gene_type:complete